MKRKRIISLLSAISLLLVVLQLPVFATNYQGGAFATTGSVDARGQLPTYNYVIHDITCVDLTGKPIDKVWETDSFYAEVNLTCLSDDANKDYVILASYDGQGVLLGLTYMRCSMKIGETYDFGASIQNKNRHVGKVAAFVWGSLDGLCPLSNKLEKDLLVSSKKVAILNNAYVSESGDAVKASLVLSTGEAVTYEVDEKKFGDGTLSGAAAELKNIVFDDGGERLATEKRVVEYKINSSNRIVACDVAGGIGSSEPQEYDADRLRFGTVRIDETTKILDANNPADIKALALSDLRDETEYVVYGFDKSNDGICRFIVITKGESGITKDTGFVVFLDISPSVNPETDETCDFLNVVGTSKAKYVLENGYKVIDDRGETTNLTKSDVIIFDTNTKGEVATIIKLFDNSDIYTNYIGDFMNGVSPFPAAFTLPDAWTNPSDNIKLAFGAITEKDGNRAVLSKVTRDDEGKVVTTVDERWDTVITDETNVMVYDFSESKTNRLKVGTLSSIKAVSVKAATDENTGLIHWNNVAESTLVRMNYAFAKIMNDEIVDIFVILAE